MQVTVARLTEDLNDVYWETVVAKVIKDAR